MRIGIVGAGWAGLAAAVRAQQAGHAATLFDMAPRAGGRARSDADDDASLDNGQHILLGGYERTLALMRDVGVDPDVALRRLPFALMRPDGSGLALRGGLPAWIDAGVAVLSARGLSSGDKWSMLRCALAWRRAGFTCDASLTVEELLCRTATPRLRERVFDPLCDAALNTPAEAASAQVFLAVLRDTLFGAPGASDLLLPQWPLGRLLPTPALRWLELAGADVRLRTRVTALEAEGGLWRLRSTGGQPTLGDGAAALATPAFDESVMSTNSAPTSASAFSSLSFAAAADRADVFDFVVMACAPTEAARLCQAHAASWSEVALALVHEPIATVWLEVPVRPWPAPMLSLPSDRTHRPAQFAFKAGPALRAALQGSPRTSPLEGATRTAPRPPDDLREVITLVVSAAAPWAAQGLAALRDAAVAQAREAFAWPPSMAVACIEARIDRRATFRCSAGGTRPPAQIASHLVAAGDYVSGPYPATLEAAVRAGEAAIALLTG